MFSFCDLRGGSVGVRKAVSRVNKRCPADATRALSVCMRCPSFREQRSGARRRLPPRKLAAQALPPSAAPTDALAVLDQVCGGLLSTKMGSAIGCANAGCAAVGFAGDSRLRYRGVCSLLPGGSGLRLYSLHLRRKGSGHACAS